MSCQKSIFAASNFITKKDKKKMKTTAEKLKDLVMFAAIALALLPQTMNAQNDTFFRGGFGDNINNRDIDIVYGLLNDPFGEAPTPYGFDPTQGSSLPLGSGLLIMLAAGAGYAIARSKRSLKKTSALLLACVMTLTLTQCGKKLQTITTNGETVNITLNVGNGGRHIIEPGPGYVPITYEAGDVMYVGNGGLYAGKLTCSVNDGPFVGNNTVNDPTDDLYFYFLGGLETKDLEPGTESLTVDISNQSSKLPVLSMGRAEYIEGQTSFYCGLTNKCALVEFDFAEGTNKKVKISNMLCEAKIDFTNNSIAPTEKLDAISLYSFNETEKWGILLLSDVERKSMGMVYNRTDYYSYTGPDVEIDIYDYYDGVTVPALSDNNNFLYGNNAIAVDNSANNKNNRVFVVSANGNAVRFAPGNLKCTKTGATWAEGYEWSFMEHQYEMVETNKKPYCTDNYEDKDVVSLFGWGCTGMQDKFYNGNQNYFMPYNTIWGNDVYGPTGYHDLSVQNESDWGAVVPNAEGYNWRVLTKDEWNYMTQNRYNAHGKMGGARVMDQRGIVVNGAIFLPEDASASLINNPSIPMWKDNDFATVQDLGAFLDETGALFLPAAGYRSVKNVTSRNSEGRYWAATSKEDNVNYAYNMCVMSGTSFHISDFWRAMGYSVRLAR